jgi:hypothetical protein
VVPAFLLVLLDLAFDLVDDIVDGQLHVLGLFLPDEVDALGHDVDFRHASELFNGKDDVGFHGFVDVFLELAQPLRHIILEPTFRPCIPKGHGNLHAVFPPHPLLN